MSRVCYGKEAEGNVRRLPSFGLLAAKRQTRGSRFRDQSVLLVGNGALDVADRLAPPHDRSFRFELCLPDQAKEIDFQFHGSNGFIWGESTSKRYAHRGIGNVAKNAAVQRSTGLARCGPTAKTTVARPSAMSFASNPISRAMGTSFVFARSLKSACEGIS